MTNNGPLHNKLKEATLSLHHQAEHNQFATFVMQEHAPLEVYIQWLIRFYGFYQPLEDFILHSNFLTDKGFYLRERLRTPLLCKDLKFLGRTELEISCYPQCMDMPNLNDPSSLLGCLYVVEGSSLGGQFIVKKLRQIYGFVDNNGCEFFNCYGEKTGERWKEFCLFLNQCSFNADGQNAVIQGALDTFEKLNAWLNSGGLNE